jgi:hypothetical protein
MKNDLQDKMSEETNLKNQTTGYPGTLLGVTITDKKTKKTSFT